MSHLLQDVPGFSTFVRDQLAEHCDGLGHDVECVDLPSGERMIYVDSMAGYARIYVDGATLLDADDRLMRPLRLRGFTWQPMPTDTGTVHGPRLFGERHVHWREHPFTGQRVAGTPRTV